jgi:Chitobiase/beta-hexosaminidase C-terminal domain
MGFRIHRLGLAVVSVLSLWASSGQAQVNVTTYHNDNARTGQNTQEAYLTPANVNSGQFGKLFTVAVDGAVFAQPLYLTNVNIGGATHNVVYIATQHDSVYAIDADTGSLYWQKSLIPAGGSTVSSNTDLNFCGDIAAEVGITSTPVIDATTGTLYVVAKVKLNGAILQYLHALDVSSAAEKFGGPVSIQASVPGTATDGNGSMVAFDPRQENQRAGLLLENGHVVISWAAHCDKTPYHGWVMSYGSTTLTQEGVYNTSPNGSANGIWMSGAGPAADSSGNIYFATGNGTWSATDNGDSIVKLGPPSGSTLPLLDYFTPYDQGSLSAADLDVSAGGVVLLPTLSNGKKLLAMLSKAGTIYLIDTSGMGKYCVTQTPACTGSDTNIVQEIPKAFTGYWGAPAYWNGYLYWSGGNDTSGAAEPLKAYSFNANGSGLISTSPSSVAAHSFNFSGPVPSVSSNGTSNGIVWGMDNGSFASTCSGGTNCQVLYAYDATNLATMLYNSSQAANNRDVPGTAVKFTTPTIANGKVYVAGKGSVSAFGLLSAVSPTATAPTLSPVGGTYTSAQTVSLADTTPGAVMHYTTDGSTPTTASATYAASITVSSTTTVEAIAVASGYTTSPVGSATYTISAAAPTAAAPTFSPASGTYTATQTVTLSDSTAGAAIYYTTDGTTPTAASAKYSTALTVAATTTIKAIAVATGYTNSAVTSATYTISATQPAAAAPTVSPAAGTYTSAQAVTLADGTPGAVIHYTTDGSTPTNASAVYSAALSVNATTVVKAIAVAGGYTNSAVTSATYTISATGSPVSTPVALAAAGNVYAIGTNATAVTNGGIDTWGYAYSSSLLGPTVSWSGVTFNLGAAGTAGAVSNATIALPAISSATLNLLAVAVNGGHKNSFVVTYTDGTSTTFRQSLSDWISSKGNAGESVAVTMAYRLNPYGVIDNLPVYLYGYSFALDGAKTVKSLTLPATRNIVVMAATLSSMPVSTPAAAATPTLSPGTGSYTAAQTVTMADTTPGAVIYYTTDGSTPTTGSTKYTAAVTVSATATIKAMAAAGGYSSSAVASATYTISSVPPTTAATPTLSPAGGTYTSAQTVTISDTTAGAVIYYTTNGSTPTTASTQYAAAITVSATGTVKAIAVASGYSNSAVAGATYTISAAPAAAAPTMSLAAGTYTSTQTLTLADATPGAVIYYTTNGSTPTTASAVYSTALTVSATTTVKAIAIASGYSNSAVSSATYTITTTVSAGTSPVSLTAAFNVNAIGTSGTPVTNGGIDTWGYAYSSGLLGSTVTWSGVTFNLGAAGTADAVSNTTITLPAVKSSKLNLLAAGVNGSHANQTFVLTYTDGTTTTLTQSVSDWYAAQNYTGESIAATMAYRIDQYGVVDNHAVDLYGYSFAIDSTKTVKSLQLPGSRNVVVLAAAL